MVERKSETKAIESGEASGLRRANVVCSFLAQPFALFIFFASLLLAMEATIQAIGHMVSFGMKAARDATVDKPSEVATAIELSLRRAKEEGGRPYVNDILDELSNRYKSKFYYVWLFGLKTGIDFPSVSKPEKLDFSRTTF